MSTFENEYQWDVVETIEYYNYKIEVSCCMDIVYTAKVLNDDGSLNESLTPIFNEDVSREALVDKCQTEIMDEILRKKQKQKTKDELLGNLITLSVIGLMVEWVWICRR